LAGIAAGEPPAASFFAPPGAKLSQGDIVHDVPWGVLDAPVIVCRPRVPLNTKGIADYAQPHECARQPAFTRGPELVHARAGRPGPAVVLWEDCEIDKFEELGEPFAKWFVAVCPIFPLTTIRSPDGRERSRSQAPGTAVTNETFAGPVAPAHFREGRRFPAPAKEVLDDYRAPGPRHPRH
jgi:hypothetical protein